MKKILKILIIVGLISILVNFFDFHFNISKGKLVISSTFWNFPKLKVGTPKQVLIGVADCTVIPQEGWTIRYTDGVPCWQPLQPSDAQLSNVINPIKFNTTTIGSSLIKIVSISVPTNTQMNIDIESLKVKTVNSTSTQAGNVYGTFTRNAIGVLSQQGNSISDIYGGILGVKPAIQFSVSTTQVNVILNPGLNAGTYFWEFLITTSSL